MEPSEEGEDVTAIGLLQQSTGLGSVLVSDESEEPEDDEELVSEREESEEVDESAFGRPVCCGVLC